MTFAVREKVALVSGGASGIGLECVKELLKNGLRGVVIADINTDYGNNAVKEIDSEFGEGKALFVRTDVSNKDSYEGAFKETIGKYKNLDILINNAAILDDKAWEREIAINLNGTINGILLALEHYIPKYRTSEEGVIVNISSGAGLLPFPPMPIYNATKFATRALTIAFGANVHYTRTKVKVFTVCPGFTDTPILENLQEKVIGPEYHTILETILGSREVQPSTHVSKCLVQLIKTAKTGTIWVITEGKDAYEFVETNVKL